MVLSRAGLIKQVPPGKRRSWVHTRDIVRLLSGKGGLVPERGEVFLSVGGSLVVKPGGGESGVVG